MTDDLLKEAAGALKRETAADDDSGRFTRARVMASLHQSQVRRRTRLAFVIPLAASFAAATAWGTVSGRAPELARSVAEALGFEVNPVPKATEPSARPRPRRAAPNVRKPSPNPPPETSSLPAPIEAPPSEAPAPVERAPASAPAPRPSARAFERDPAHDLYRSAHRTHFVEQNWGRALEGWSRYLEAAPRGRFAPEARYNRALCLVRLGDREAARTALLPFAKGQYGTYRQREALELVEALAR